MTLTETPLIIRLEDYKNLTLATHEGDYINICDITRYNAYNLGTTFLSNMDVYPSDKLTTIREFFHL